MPEKLYGLLGKNIAYSFSEKYFTDKFSTNSHQNCYYKNFDCQNIEEFTEILRKSPDLKGFNITIPYKEAIIPYLNKLSKKAAHIGAVNTVRCSKKGRLKGYNTDCHGFMKSLKPLLKSHHKKALILGTGGAAKAVAFALNKLLISYDFASRNPTKEQLNYTDIDTSTFQKYQIIINCTPLGTTPHTDNCPPLPYEAFTPNHIAYDLIYNPVETTFLKKAQKQGATIKNGYEMLVLQAEKAWEIWNK